MSAVVHVIDDDEPLREAVARLLRAEGYEVLLHASAGAFLLTAPEPRAGCIVLDLQMPGPDGLELQEAMRRRDPSIPVVFLSGRGDIAASVRAMKAGAVDFLTKPVDPGRLVAAVQSALERHRRERGHQASSHEVRERWSQLTPRERSVFGRVVEGAPNKQIARELGITERTVKAHRAQVMAKMRAESIAQLVQIASLLDAS